MGCGRRRGEGRQRSAASYALGYRRAASPDRFRARESPSTRPAPSLCPRRPCLEHAAAPRTRPCTGLFFHCVLTRVCISLWVVALVWYRSVINVAKLLRSNPPPPRGPTLSELASVSGRGGGGIPQKGRVEKNRKGNASPAQRGPRREILHTVRSVAVISPLEYLEAR